MNKFKVNYRGKTRELKGWDELKAYIILQEMINKDKKVIEHMEIFHWIDDRWGILSRKGQL